LKTSAASAMKIMCGGAFVANVIRHNRRAVSRPPESHTSKIAAQCRRLKQRLQIVPGSAYGAVTRRISLTCPTLAGSLTAKARHGASYVCYKQSRQTVSSHGSVCSHTLEKRSRVFPRVSQNRSWSSWMPFHVVGHVKDHVGYHNVAISI
jgi:hypothetical protein